MTFQDQKVERRLLSPLLPIRSVRGTIRDFIELHADLLGSNVLECGTLMPAEGAWWMNNRDLARGRWTGTDFREGLNVDLVADLEALPKELDSQFSGVLCSEVLEHVRRPSLAIAGLLRVLRPGGAAIFTTLTAFPIHGYPDDYRRWTESGLRADLEDAGFTNIATESAGQINFMLNDHGEDGLTLKHCPMHVFALANKAC
jgi:SAM-dependent methyltransferase